MVKTLFFNKNKYFYPMLNLKDKFLNINNESFIFEICETFLQEYGGNIIEIGAGEGYSTKNFLNICHNKSKHSKVIVIDPFESGWDEMPPTYGTPYPFSQFYRNVKLYEDYLQLIKKSSQDNSIYNDLINFKPITFAFVDGLQYKQAVINDLELMNVLDCKLICVDDFTRINEFSEVPLAVDYFLKKYNYNLFYDNKQIRSKAYLIKNI